MHQPIERRVRRRRLAGERDAAAKNDDRENGSRIFFPAGLHDTGDGRFPCCKLRVVAAVPRRGLGGGRETRGADSVAHCQVIGRWVHLSLTNRAPDP